MRVKLDTTEEIKEYYRGFKIGAQIIDDNIVSIGDIELIIDEQKTSELYYSGVYESFTLPILQSSGEKLDHLGKIRKMIFNKIK